MFWNHISFIYDIFENAYNPKANKEAVRIVQEQIAPGDKVLECACGTGMFSEGIADRCMSLTATDFAPNMLKKASQRARKRGLNNCTFELADITDLQYEDGSFDKIVAANVIHLLDDPAKAVSEFKRIVKPGGEIIIPTYINLEQTSASVLVKMWNKMGANFQRQFDRESYQKFFEDLGLENVEYHIADGRMPCDVAVISL